MPERPAAAHTLAAAPATRAKSIVDTTPRATPATRDRVTRRRNMPATTYQEVIEQFCRAVGFPDAQLLINGGRLRLDEYLATFIYDPGYDADTISVYVDLGPVRDTSAAALARLLRLNFELGTGERGMMSLHPESGHALYAFGYRLDEKASGQDLLDVLVNYVSDVSVQLGAATPDTEV